MKFAYVLANICEDKVNVQETVAIFKAQCSGNVIGERSGTTTRQLNGVH